VDTDRRRLGLLGQVKGRNQTRVAEKTSENEAEGRGNVEKARLRLLEDVQNYLQETKLKRQKAVSRWLPTAAARVHARVWSSEICGEQSGAGAGFPLEYFGFPCQCSYHQVFHPHNNPGQV
jgi:hypothetical protein